MSSRSKLAAAVAATCARAAAGSARRAVWVVLAYTLLATGSLWLAMTELAVDTNPDEMISPDLPFRKLHFDLVEAFPGLNNTFVVVIDAKTGSDGLKAARELAKSFSDRSDLFSQVFAPGTSRFFQDYGLLYLPQADIERVVATIKQAAPMLETLAANPNISGMAQLIGGIGKAAAGEMDLPGAEQIVAAIDETLQGELSGNRQPLKWDSLIAANEDKLPKRWFVMASPNLDYSALDPSAAPYNEARWLVDHNDMARAGLVDLHLTGEAAMNAEEFHAVVRGASLAGVTSLALVSVIVFIGLPLLRLSVPALALLIFGFAINAGFATLAVGYLNLISVAFVVLFIGLGIDYAVHILLRFAEEVRAGHDLHQALARAAGSAGPALALCTVTTALAFLSFTPTAFAGMAQLGVIAAAGTVIAFVASLSLVPAVLAFMPSVVPALRAKPARSWTWTRKITGSLRLPLSLAVIVIAGACVLLLPGLRFNSDPVDLKDPDASSVAMFKRLIAEDASLAYAGELLVRPGAGLEKLMAELTALPEVDRVVTLDTYLPDNQPEKLTTLAPLRQVVPAETARIGSLDTAGLADGLDELQIAASQLAATQSAPAALRQAAGDLAGNAERFITKSGSDAKALSLLDAAWFASFPPLLERLRRLAAAQPITDSTIDADLRSRYIAADGRRRVEVVPTGDLRNDAELDRFVTAVSKVAPDLTGAPVEISGAASAVTEAMRWAVMAAIALVVLVVAPILRRPIDVGLVLAPLALAALLLCGYSVVFDAPFNFANVIVLPLLLGLGVDSSIHYVMRAREHHEDEIVDTSTPRAVLVSALTTIGSFGTLWLSPHRGMASMGELLTIAIIVTLITTLIVLPQLIAWADRLFPPPEG